MYAAIRKGQSQPGKRDELARRIEQDFLPRVKQLPGFIAYYVVLTGEEEITSVSIFEDEAGAEQSTSMSRAWVAEEIGPTLMVGGLGTSGGEVVAHIAR